MRGKKFADSEALSIYISIVSDIARHRRTIKMFVNPDDFYPAVQLENLRYNQSVIDEHKMAIKQLNGLLDNLLMFIEITDVWKR